MNKADRVFTFTALIACPLACITNYVVIFGLGSMYPGYSQVSNTLSEMGVAGSPVSHLISGWWVILGVIIILFGIGFRKAFRNENGIIKLASWFIIIYGIGDDIGSGLFRISRMANGQLTPIGLLHDGLGGIGVAAMLILPLILLSVFPKRKHRGFYRLSIGILIAAPLSLILFSISKSINDPFNFFVLYKGVWQRLLGLTFYIYLSALAIMSLKHVKSREQGYQMKS